MTGPHGGRRWRWRLVGGAVVFAVLQTVFTVMSFEPDAVRLALLVGLGTATAGLLLDSVNTSSLSWDVVAVSQTTTRPNDPRTARYLSLLQAHTTARAPAPAVRDRIASLAELVLLQRHGLQRHDLEAVRLLGPDLVRVLDEPPRRLSRTEIDRYLTRIEDL